MFLLSKLIAQILLPPGGLVLLLGLGLWKVRHVWGKALIVLSMVLLYALSTEPVRDALTRPLEFQYPAFHPQPLDAEHTAIVLLGGGVYEQAPEYQGRDSLHDSALMRTVYAAHLAKQTGLPVYASGGKPLNPEQQDAEGTVMMRMLVEMGVAKNQLFAENFANNTWQNATHLQTVLQKKGVTTVVLVTSAWHMPRSAACFAAQGLQVVAAPTDYKTKMGRYDVRSYVPQATAFEDSSWALHEYLGLWFYHMRYGI